MGDMARFQCLKKIFGLDACDNAPAEGDRRPMSLHLVERPLAENLAIHDIGSIHRLTLGTIGQGMIQVCGQNQFRSPKKGGIPSWKTFLEFGETLPPLCPSTARRWSERWGPGCPPPPDAGAPPGSSLIRPPQTPG